MTTAHASETSCFGIPSDDNIVCSARGKCIKTDQCVCDTNYFGVLCHVTTCFGRYSNDTLVCSGFGACVAHDSCSCTMGYTGSDCSQWLYGEAYSIGSNSRGQLGVDDAFDRGGWTRISAPLSYGDHVKFMHAGADFAVAISRENKLFIWGMDNYFNLGKGLRYWDSVRPHHLLPTYQFTSACAGRFHGAAVTTTGKVFTWGTNTQEGRFVCTKGTVTCSETNCPCSQSSDAPTIFGMLGLGDYYYSTTPREVSLSETVVEIRCDLYHTVARTTAGGLYAWGHGSYGQLGVGDWSNRYTPTLVSISATKIVMVATGRYHTVALSTQGKVFTWGDNSRGQLGYTGLSKSNQPTLVRSTILTLPIIQVAAGSNSSYALTSTGEVYAWGDNSQGQLGLGFSGSSVSIPTRVPGLEGVHVISMSCSANTVMAVDRNGSAYSWGVNTNGPAADGNFTSKIVPTLVVNPYPRKIVGAAPGNVFSLVLFNTTYCFDFPMDDELACSARGRCIDTDTCLCNANYDGDKCNITSCFGTRSNDSTVCSAIGQCIAHDACQCPTGHTGEQCEKKIFGSLRSVGRNANGQIGDDYLIQRSDMTKVYYPLGDGTLVSKIVAGNSISFAITTSGRLYSCSWGQGTFHRLGNQALTDRLIPTLILPDHKIVSVCSGYYHSVAVTSEGKIYSWGVK